MTPF
jgi:hypothetical protein